MIMNIIIYNIKDAIGAAEDIITRVHGYMACHEISQNLIGHLELKLVDMMSEIAGKQNVKGNMSNVLSIMWLLVT